MPVNSNCWCTYNIVIHDPGSAGLKPYVINYVANRHQNDAANPEYDKYGLPQFFVSCNLQVPIPENMILKGLDGSPAVANLRPNNFDFDTMQAQSRIETLQGYQNIYCAGGWTHGSGLNEECWAQGQDIAALILQHAQTGSPQEPGKAKDVGQLFGDRLRRNACSDSSRRDRSILRRHAAVWKSGAGTEGEVIDCRGRTRVCHHSTDAVR